MKKASRRFFSRPATAGCAALLSAALFGCERPRWGDSRDDGFFQKVMLDLSSLDALGLRGPDGGKVSVAYEFVIPEGEKFRAEVQALDATVRFMPGSRGRIGARPGECLCVGETGPDFRTVLRNLAALPYVKKIVPCDFE